MFANLLHLVTRRPAETGYDLAFVKDVHVPRRRIRSVRMERLILASWIAIAAKAALLEWAVHRWPVPVEPLWVIAPTVAMGLMCTAIYYSRR